MVHTTCAADVQSVISGRQMHSEKRLQELDSRRIEIDHDGHLAVQNLILEVLLILDLENVFTRRGDCQTSSQKRIERSRSKRRQRQPQAVHVYRTKFYSEFFLVEACRRRMKLEL